MGPEDVLGGPTFTLRCRDIPPEDDEILCTCGTMLAVPVLLPDVLEVENDPDEPDKIEDPEEVEELEDNFLLPDLI